MKKIDGNKVVYELVTEHPELKEILVDLGFTPLNNDAMLNTMGRMMTLNNGAKQIKLNHEALREKLKENGYELEE